jgi:hypothetical protein
LKTIKYYASKMLQAQRHQFEFKTHNKKFI